ncbi:MAG: hypothetical protein K6F34_06880 [Lachnospiraceae bacterium]|nr:hypothetical protein [Lachnospiraceae bacterium]
MEIAKCNGSYLNDLKEYTGNILDISGVSSPGAERGIMYMADSGNIVAMKLYGDLIYYKRVARKRPYYDAFMLYLASAGITVGSNGEVSSAPGSYPPAMRSVGAYLTDYKMPGPLKDCDDIDIIESMSYGERLTMALKLACACARATVSPQAVNLIGRILDKGVRDEELFTCLRPAVINELGTGGFAGTSLRFQDLDTPAQWEAALEACFDEAAGLGYVYACNNRAARLASFIIPLAGDKGNEETLNRMIDEYVSYLKASADKYEPYAANRLGLLYMTGEICSGNERALFKDRIDRPAAKEYFLKATAYPDRNSAWAYFNLIKYYHKDYDNNIELLNEHMDMIKKLDPGVYGLAMEL